MSAQHAGSSAQPVRDRVEIPWDQEAEESVVGIAVGSAAGARLATERLTPEDFYRPAYGRVLEITSQLTGMVGEERRISTIARLAGIHHRELAALVENRPCSFDTNGEWAHRVKSAARRRCVMALAAEIYNGASQSATFLRDCAEELLAEITALAPEGHHDGSVNR